LQTGPASLGDLQPFKPLNRGASDATMEDELKNVLKVYTPAEGRSAEGFFLWDTQ
jgi:hypothetical protein